MPAPSGAFQRHDERRVYRQSTCHREYLRTAGCGNGVFFKHLSLSGKIEGLYREEELEIPYKALRECCTNALCHRSYHRPGSSVGIAIYDDRVEIENSGTFPPDMTMEKLLSGHNSEPQNLIIANVLYKSEVLKAGEGASGLL